MVAAALALVGSVTIAGFTVDRVMQPDAAAAPRSGRTTAGFGMADGTPTLDASSATPDLTFTPSPYPRPSPTGETARLRRLLAEVSVVARRPGADGYDRSCTAGAGCSFGTSWTDDTTADLGHNGCDTRNDALGAQLRDIVFDPGTNGCVVRSGILDDPYTGRRIDFLRGPWTSRAVEIDHIIPLAAAWDLGAWKWSQQRRDAFANDVTRELLAVDGPANQQKSDSTPAAWLPSNKAFRCQYATRYLDASVHWRLPITASDAKVVAHLARRCS